jgi:membrane-associated phospholipid phosphatase
MSFIDLEAFGVVAAVLWGTQVFVGRERPYVPVCRSDPEFAAREGDCVPDDDWNRSFISGHPAVGVTAAALTCLHHSRMPLYGGAADPLICGLTIAAATANGLGRVMTEKHYASELVLGVGLGLVAGYVIPKALHHGWGSGSSAPPAERAARGARARIVILPALGDRGLGVMAAGIL